MCTANGHHCGYTPLTVFHDWGEVDPVLVEVASVDLIVQNRSNIEGNQCRKCIARLTDFACTEIGNKLGNASNSLGSVRANFRGIEKIGGKGIYSYEIFWKTPSIEQQ